MSSFVPVTNNSLNTSLLGTGTLTNFEAISERPIHGVARQHEHIISIIVLSAILFVLIVSLFDVIKVMVTNYYAKIALQNTISHNNQDDIDRTIEANEERLQATFMFFLICLIITLIFVPIIYLSLQNI